SLVDERIAGTVAAPGGVEAVKLSATLRPVDLAHAVDRVARNRDASLVGDAFEVAEGIPVTGNELCLIGNDVVREAKAGLVVHALAGRDRVDAGAGARGR